MRYTREDLVRHVENNIYACALCCGTGTDDVEFVNHNENCPLADPEVDRVWVVGKKRMADATICGRCGVDVHLCPVNGWACTTHEQALKRCERYREHYVT